MNFLFKQTIARISPEEISEENLRRLIVIYLELIEVSDSKVDRDRYEELKAELDKRTANQISL